MNENDQAPKLIEVPEHLKPESIRDGSVRAVLGSEAVEAAQAATRELDGRSGLGVTEVPMPADPSRVPGWEDDIRH